MRQDSDTRWPERDSELTARMEGASDAELQSDKALCGDAALVVRLAKALVDRSEFIKKNKAVGKEFGQLPVIQKEGIVSSSHCANSAEEGGEFSLIKGTIGAHATANVQREGVDCADGITCIVGAQTTSGKKLMISYIKR